MNTVTLTEDAINLIAVDVVDHYLRYYIGEPGGSNLDSESLTFLFELAQYHVLGETDISRLVDRVFDEATEMLNEELEGN